MSGLFAKRVLTTTAMTAAPAALSAKAASMGYTQADSRMNRGVTLAVITLAAVVYTVIIGVLMLTAYLLHRKAKARQKPAAKSINV